MRHWHPFIQETVEEIIRAGYQRVVGIAMAPHYSNMSVGTYEKKLLQTAGERLDSSLVRSRGHHPRFLDAVTNRGKDAPPRFPRPPPVRVILRASQPPEPQVP